MKSYIALFLLISLAGCQAVETKRQAFPSMYDDGVKPVTIVVVPALNSSTAADAGELMMATVAQPFADNGYYVVPLPLVAQVFRDEGISDGAEMLNVPAEVLRDSFGADSVLYITIEKWETNYAVLAANVIVGLSYVLRSTQDDSVLWSYKTEMVVNTGGNSTGFLLADIVKTAVSTALTDYLPIAYQVNAAAVVTMPHGKYHPKVGQDGSEKVVVKSSKEEAVNDLSGTDSK